MCKNVQKCAKCANFRKSTALRDFCLGDEGSNLKLKTTETLFKLGEKQRCSSNLTVPNTREGILERKWMLSAHFAHFKRHLHILHISHILHIPKLSTKPTITKITICFSRFQKIGFYREIHTISHTLESMVFWRGSKPQIHQPRFQGPL